MRLAWRMKYAAPIQSKGQTHCYVRRFDRRDDGNKPACEFAHRHGCASSLRMEPNERITIDPGILEGAPVFRGIRVPVQTLSDYLERSESVIVASVS